MEEVEFNFFQLAKEVLFEMKHQRNLPVNISGKVINQVLEAI